MSITEANKTHESYLIRCLADVLSEIGPIIPSFWIAYQKLRIMDSLQWDTMTNGVKKSSDIDQSLIKEYA